MAIVPGPYIPSLDEASKLGITDPNTLKMLSDYHQAMAEPIPQPTAPPNPGQQMPMEPTPGPEPDYGGPAPEAEKFGIQPLPEANLTAFDGKFTGDPDNPLPEAEEDPAGAAERLQPPAGVNLDDFFNMSDYAAANAKRRQGAYMVAAGAEAQANAESQYLAGLDARMKDHQRDVQVQEIARKKRVDAEIGKLNEAMTAFQDAKIDPNRMWSSASNASKTFMALGMALGALGQAHTGGRNTAIDIVKQAIDDDINIQKAEIAKLGQHVTNRRNLLQDMRTMFSDERQAESAAKMALLDQAKVKLQQLAAQYKSPQIQGNLLQAIGQFDMELAKAKGDFMEQAAIKALSAGAEGIPVPEKLKPYYVPGWGVAQAGQPSDVSKFRMEIMPEMTGARDKISRLLLLAQKGSKANIDDRNEASSLAQQLQSELRMAVLGPGAVTDTEREILKQIAPDPMVLFQWPGAVKKLQTLDSGIERKLNIYASAIGLKPAAKQIRNRDRNT